MQPIALGSLFIECNHFGGCPADMATFQRGGLHRGEEMLGLTAGTIGGMLKTLQDAKRTVTPLLSASACPSGPITAECYEELKTEFLHRLRKALPVDGVLLALHGAAAGEGVGDVEGDLLATVRSVVGDDVPVVATLDLHAHVTEVMVRHSDALLAWETYPHADAFSTGKRGARAMFDILDGSLRPFQVMAKVPVMVGAIHGQTDPPGPFAEILQRGKTQEGRGGVYSVSVFLVHPYLDLPDMGGGALVVSDGSPEAAQELAADLSGEYWQRRHELEPELLTPAEAVAAGLQTEGGPVLLVETADCCGGGAAGDSVHALRALLEAVPDVPSLTPVVDPAAAAACHAAGLGSSVQLKLGHQLDPKWGETISVNGTVRQLSNGQFHYEGGIWDGQPGDMGPTAVLQMGVAQIVITTHPTYDWGREQFDSLGLQPSDFKFIVAKNPMNFRRAYVGIMTAHHVLDTPGPTPASVRGLSFRNLRRPWFPRDEEISDCQPVVLRGRQRG